MLQVKWGFGVDHLLPRVTCGIRCLAADLRKASRRRANRHGALRVRCAASRVTNQGQRTRALPGCPVLRGRSRPFICLLTAPGPCGPGASTGAIPGETSGVQAAGGRKDPVVVVEETGGFVCGEVPSLHGGWYVRWVMTTLTRPRPVPLEKSSTHVTRCTCTRTLGHRGCGAEHSAGRRGRARRWGAGRRWVVAGRRPGGVAVVCSGLRRS